MIGKSGFFLRLLHNRKQRALFAFLTIVPIKSQVYPQQQTKQSSSRNIQDLKVLGKFVSGCVSFLCSNSRYYLVKSLVTHTLQGFLSILIFIVMIAKLIGPCRSCWCYPCPKNHIKKQ